MRTRKLMTALTLATIIILAAAQTSLTSASYRVDVLQSPVYGEINRESGLLLKVGYGTPHDPSDILSSETSRQVEALFGEDFLVSPRVWYYPVSTYPSGISIRALSQSGYYLLGSVVILGLSFSESKEAFFFEGPALSNIPNSVLLPSTIAKTLNVTLGDSIYIDCVGQPLVVSGIFSVEVSAGLSDYDGGSILPIDPRYQQVLGLISSPLTQLPPENIPITNVIVVPSEIASSLGGFVSSIALLPKHPLTNEEMRTTAESLSLLTGVTVYLKTNTVSVGLYFITRPSVIGVWGLALLLVISVLSIINTIVGTVERRKKEIVTYSSLGLSPGGAFLMFLMESLTYALLGALIGYILGFSLSQLFINLQLLPADFVFNSSSLFVMLSLLTLFLATTGAAIYPSVLASRQITPSLERKWSLATRPRGSIWSIPLPFRFAFEYEVLGILVFLAEYYGGMGYEKKTFQVRNVYEVEKENRSLQLDVALIPLELGIMQKVTLQAVPSKMRAEYGLHILIELVRGDPHTWESKNYPFIDDIRKQILIWRTMKTEEKEKYTSAVRSLN